MVIDSHQHFWYYNAEKHGWIDEQMIVLKRDFLPSDLAKVYAQNGIDGCIAVQADQSAFETEFLLTLANEFDMIKGVVGWVDLKAADIETQLHYYNQYPLLKGFRHVVQDEPDPNFMLHPAFQHGIGLLAKFNFIYDILIFPTQLEAAISTIQAFPNQVFVLDHIAKPYIKSGEIAQWATHIAEMAANDNVHCKLSGMVTEAHWHQWTYDQFVPYLDIVVEAFGIDRLLFGSDWPVCLLAGSFEDMKSIIDTYFAQFSAMEKAKLMGLNAQNIYLNGFTT